MQAEKCRAAVSYYLTGGATFLRDNCLADHAEKCLNPSLFFV